MLLYRQNQERENADRAAAFESQMRNLERRLRDLLSDSAEAARHNRRGESARMPGTMPGVDPDASEQRRLQIMQQRQHLQAEISQLAYSSHQFSRQAREHADEASSRRSLDHQANHGTDPRTNQTPEEGNRAGRETATPQQ